MRLFNHKTVILFEKENCVKGDNYYCTCHADFILYFYFSSRKIRYSIFFCVCNEKILREGTEKIGANFYFYAM